MAVSTTLSFESIENLNLDPMNPRLGRHKMASDTPQETLIEWMRAFKLDELALSYLESGGFWSHEPLIVVEEPLYRKKKSRIVVEGNRRLAALKCLQDAVNGDPPSTKWSEMLEGVTLPDCLFERIPYVLADSREDVQAFLGFRHVTGIKQWDADEKAGFITHLIDDGKLSYEHVARKIGSTTPTVRRHYIAYRLLLQMETVVEDFPIKKAERRFAVLYGTIQTTGAQSYLGLNIAAEPKPNQNPIPKKHLQHLTYFSRWIYGTTNTLPLVTDTRQISKFGQILESPQAVEYLKSNDQPDFDVAYRIAGGDEPELVKLLSNASDQVEEALRTIHLYKSSGDIQKAVRRLGADVFQVLNTFPTIRQKLEEEQQ